jgi:hypothetical protein
MPATGLGTVVSSKLATLIPSFGDNGLPGLGLSTQLRSPMNIIFTSSYIADLPHLILMAASTSPACLYAAGLPLCHHHRPCVIVIVHPQSLQSFYISLSMWLDFASLKLFSFFSSSKYAVEVCDIYVSLTKFLPCRACPCLLYFCSCVQLLLSFSLAIYLVNLLKFQSQMFMLH